MPYLIRYPVSSDVSALQLLYKAVAAVPDCLARRPHEIDLPFIQSLIEQTTEAGLMLVLEHRGEVVGAIHATHGELQGLRHVMGQLTILIHPAFQKRGYGKKLFAEFLKLIEENFSYIRRVELRAIASNAAALKLYESLGFEREGLFRGRILSERGHLEDGIPMAWINPRWREASLSL